MRLCSSLLPLGVLSVFVVFAASLAIPATADESSQLERRNPTFYEAPVKAESEEKTGPRYQNHTPDKFEPESAQDDFWMSNVKHQGVATFNPNKAEYKVYRDVKACGAKGDGVTDDTVAINECIAAQWRCGPGCDSSTTTPALVYFPPGTYLVSKPVIAYYYSQFVGNPNDRAIIKASPSFKGMSVIDADPYYPNTGDNWYTNQNNFFRSIRNLIIDGREMAKSSYADGAPSGIHWQVSQATSLVNIKIIMDSTPETNHRGLFIDNGSGGYMADMEFEGGKFGMWTGSQQFYTRNITFNGQDTAIWLQWDWLWTFQNIFIKNCRVGIQHTYASPSETEGGPPVEEVGTLLFQDSVITNTDIFLVTNRNGNPFIDTAQSAVLENVKLVNVPIAILGKNDVTLLEGGSKTIDFWVQGNTYDRSGEQKTVLGPMTPVSKRPEALLDANGYIFSKSRPQYAHVPASNFKSVKTFGLAGDGVTDDTAKMREMFETYGGKGEDAIIFFDHGHYIVSSTVFVPVNTIIVGEVWSVIMADGDSFQDENKPVPVWKVGNPGDVGLIEMSELNFQTRGPQRGAILMQWNARGKNQGENSMHDVHFRVGGSRGTELEVAQCIKTPDIDAAADGVNPACYVAFMQLHIAETASVYLENSWAWTSDHSMDIPWDQISIYNPRGILVEANPGPTWLYATMAEHNTLYQYQLSHAKNVYMGLIQTETPYFQPNPVATVPTAPLEAWNDPMFADCNPGDTACLTAWSTRILDSEDVIIAGAGTYSFFENNKQCAYPGGPFDCQKDLFDIQNSKAITIFALNEIASEYMIQLDGTDIAPRLDNKNKFSDTVVYFAI